ncbi:MAG TPA: glutaredoxin family protein [Tepidisphaeraceae bacterium]|jgi:glutaredoxin
MHQLILYSRPGCHLCESVEQTILFVARRRPLALTVKNIDEDAEAHSKYHELIPVVLLNGREIARYRLSTQELEAALLVAESSGEVK